MCENAVKKAFGGGGQAWKQNQQGILDHAIDLGYDRIAPLPSLSADKQTWTSWADKFNAWKRSGMPMPAVEESSRGGDSSGGFNRGLIETGDGLGPYPAYNRYFPMLTTAYEAPGFQDFSAYMTPGVFSGNNGALYQPWAGREFSYTPPEFNVGPVQYYAPVNPLEIIFEEEMSEETPTDSYDPDNPVASDSHLPKGSQGKGDGTGSYGTADDPFGLGVGSTSSGVEGSQTFGLGPSVGVSPSESYGYGQNTGFDKFGNIFDGVSDDATYP